MTTNSPKKFQEPGAVSEPQPLRAPSVYAGPLQGTDSYGTLGTHCISLK